MCQVETNRESEDNGMPFSIKVCEKRCIFKEINAEGNRKEENNRYKNKEYSGVKISNYDNILKVNYARIENANSYNRAA